MNTKPVEEVDVAEVLAEEAATGRRRRGWTWAAAAVAVAAAAVGARFATLPSAAGALQYETQPARRGNLKVTVSATGNLQPINEVSVGSELSGTVRTVEAEVNDRVKAGQILARLDTAKLKAQSEQAKASLASSQAKVLDAQATVRESEGNLGRLERLRDLTGGKTPSSSDLEAAAATLARARAEEATTRASVSQAEAVLSACETDLAKSVIRAPTRGVVLTRSVEPGQTVAASLQAPELFLLAEDLTRMELHVSVDEADVGRVRPGQEATFTVAAYPERTFPARITRVHYGSTTTSGVVTYETLLQVENPDLALRPGMTGTAEIVVQREEGALLVPNAALRFVPASPAAGAQASGAKGRGLLAALLPGPPRRTKSASTQAESPTKAAAAGKGRVWVVRGGQPAPVAVTVGSTDGVVTQVTGGAVTAGTALVVGAAGESR